MLCYLAYKNIVSRKSSFVIILFIAFAITLMVLVNSIFDSTENGIESVYSKSFTGDIVIRPVSKVPLSLFGDETPVTGELTEIPRVVPYTNIIGWLKENEQVSSFIPQISGRSVVESESSGKELETIFGLNAKDYMDMMSSIKIVDGTPYGAGERGVCLSKNAAIRYGVKVGDEIQFLVEDTMTFRIRAAKVACIYEYAIENSTLDKIIIADPFTLRSLIGMTNTTSSVVIDEESFVSGDDLDSLFDSAEDFSAGEIEETQMEEQPVEVIQDSGVEESTSWNFIVVQVKDRKQLKNIVRQMNSHFKKSEWPVQAVTWRSAAGSTAMYLYWIRIIFNVGVIIVLGAGFIVINNTLVVNVLNRTQEIGTMRAEGASRLFVSLECMIETFILTISAGILGCIFGSIASAIVSSINIHFDNSFLIQLFGSDTLNFSVSIWTILRSMGLAVVLGLVGWIYPVHTALKVSPVQAMQGAS